jgi:hypothetical protein
LAFQTSLFLWVAQANHFSFNTAGLTDIVDHVAEQLRAFFREHHVTTSNGKGRRLSAKDSEIIDDARAFLTDALGSLKNITHGSLEKLKYSYTEFDKDAVIQDIIGYFPTDIGHEAWNKTRDLITDLKDAQSFDDAYTILENTANEYCTDEVYNPPEKEPTKCTGPKVRLEFVPKKCVIDSIGHEIDCKPAKLVLKKAPGTCVFKHHTAASWSGKVCKVSKEWGKDESVTKGGEPFSAGHISSAIKAEIQ